MSIARNSEIADRAGEERVVRAAQEEAVDLRLAHRREQPFGKDVDLIRTGLAPLDELDETGTRSAGEVDLRRQIMGEALIRAARDRANRADHAHSTGDRHLDQRTQTRFENADDRNVDE